MLTKRGGMEMQFKATIKVMRELRGRNRQFGKNSLRINGWVDDYMDFCVSEGKEVMLLTQWCISKELEVRYQKQGGYFTPTKQELRIFGTDMPWMANLFHENGFRISWWLTFNRNCLESGRIDADLEAEYKQMMTGVAEPLIEEGWLLLVDWEDDILGKRAEPNEKVLGSVSNFVRPGAFQLEVERHIDWEVEAGLTQNECAREEDVRHQIACEAEEGFLIDNESLLGNVIVVPVERAERYDFFAVLAPTFKQRIVSVLPTNPWRLA
jgi:hypothetical protein